MKRQMLLKDILYFTNHQKILEFLLKNPEEEFYDRQISNLTGVSRAGTNFALRDLAKTEIVQRQKRGRMNYYRITLQIPLIKYLKILQNIVTLNPLVEKLKPLSREIILYGSSSKGENLKNSDFDLFILSNNHEQTEDILFKSSLREHLQVVTVNQNEFVKIKKKNHVFYKEISEGIILWKEK